MRAISLKIYIKILTSSPTKNSEGFCSSSKCLFIEGCTLKSHGEIFSEIQWGFLHFILLAFWSGGYTCTPCIGLLRTCFALLGFWCAPDKTKDQVLARAMSKNRRVLLNCCTYELLSLTWCLMRSFYYVLGCGTTDLPIMHIYILYHTTYVYI